MPDSVQYQTGTVPYHRPTDTPTDTGSVILGSMFVLSKLIKTSKERSGYVQTSKYSQCMPYHIVFYTYEAHSLVNDVPS